MEFAQKLYIGPSIYHKKERIFERIEQGKVILSLYCITKAGNSIDLYDIYSYRELKKDYYKQHPVVILGLAGSKEEAIGIVATMLKRDLQEEE